MYETTRLGATLNSYEPPISSRLADRRDSSVAAMRIAALSAFGI
jgi:hypothetical protein